MLQPFMPGGMLYPFKVQWVPLYFSSLGLTGLTRTYLFVTHLLETVHTRRRPKRSPQVVCIFGRGSRFKQTASTGLLALHWYCVRLKLARRLHRNDSQIIKEKHSCCSEASLRTSCRVPYLGFFHVGSSSTVVLDMGPFLGLWCWKRMVRAIFLTVLLIDSD